MVTCVIVGSTTYEAELMEVMLLSGARSMMADGGAKDVSETAVTFDVSVT